MTREEKIHVLTREYAGLPIVDAKKALRFTVTVEDLQSADPKSLQTCAFARGIRRITGSKIVAIFHTVFYVPIDKDGDGKPDIIERYTASLPAKRAIVLFDRTGRFPPGEYIINPPSKTVSFKGMAKRNKQTRERMQQQRINGTIKGGEKKTKHYSKMLGVRNGTGLVHFKELGNVKP